MPTAVTLRDIPGLVAGLVIGAPLMAALLTGVFAGGGEAWQHIVATGLLEYTTGTLATLALCAALILVSAVPAAWLVTMFSFPGRGVFEWLLILPLAAPGYVLAFAYADLLNVAGPLQGMLRDTTGLGARDYWFPDINSLPGLAFVLAGALYPYVHSESLTRKDIWMVGGSMGGKGRGSTSLLSAMVSPI